MPRENRKRGKKHRKSAVEQEEQPFEGARYEETDAENQAGPSWIVPLPQVAESNSEAPFGYVEVDVKAYFRTVDLQLREWQEQKNATEADVSGDIDPNEERRMFFVAALTEMTGKEKQLATDPDCSNILERMSHSMDDFVRRVFVDSMMGSYEQLVRHRFASHVCQTLFMVASSTISRETRGIFPAISGSDDQGELRSLTDLTLEICEELLPSFTSLIMDPFASHVLRALLLLLSPSSLPQSSGTRQNNLRSKKSAFWKTKYIGAMKSVFGEDKQEAHSKSVPERFGSMAVKFVEVLKNELGVNEVRALAADKVASPVLQMLLEIESTHDMANQPDSLMDRVLAGLISAYHDSQNSNVEPSDYVNTLFRDPTSSHLLETVVSRLSDPVFGSLWTIYIRPKLGRLVNHPIANFVIARAIERTDEEQLVECCSDLAGDGALSRTVKSARLGVLKAMVDRSKSIRARGKEVTEAVCTAFELRSPEDKNMIVPCVLYMLPLKEYQSSVSNAADADQQSKTKSYKKGGYKTEAADLPKSEEQAKESKIQGALLLQSMLQLPVPHHELVLDSLRSLPIDELIALAHHPISSRVLDVVLDSPEISPTVKRKFVMSLIGSFHVLVDDRIGSRVADKCWAVADPFLKDKLARSLIPQERLLAASYYGKFFWRNLRLPLLQRKPEEWKVLQAGKPQGVAAGAYIQSKIREAKNPGASDAGKRKRDMQVEDDIDALFQRTLGKRVKRGAFLDADSQPSRKVATDDGSLRDILKAVQLAPKDDKHKHRKKRTK
ncbi:ARM repeat-containing protein [Neolentinus lepideus HHB14362 ss-1]|uniref:Nucleolar protein 9 n=1 Tax=Neolentinus lepideus HHB14362 ss-1 TaxID=1314782 RepID=A0A165TML3_9AGAM|nr:ARM repeat-containing protein [Neolentinus lepideus HHB14362 ss-1]